LENGCHLVALLPYDARLDAPSVTEIAP
jgi:hypothetical protein